jgi:hypothetical protein
MPPEWLTTPTKVYIELATDGSLDSLVYLDRLSYYGKETLLFIFSFRHFPKENRLNCKTKTLGNR